MKNLLFLFLASSVISYVAAQDSNPCGFHWSQATRAITAGEGAVFYALQFSKCTSTGICGWPQVALEHTFLFPVSIVLKLRGRDCDGKTTTSSFSTSGNEIAANSRYTNQGNWHTFKEVTEVVRVEVSYHKGKDYYVIIYDKDKGINQTTINGKSIAEYNAQKQQEQAAANNTNTYTPINSTNSYNNENIFKQQTLNNTSAERPLNLQSPPSNNNTNTAIHNYLGQVENTRNHVNSQIMGNEVSNEESAEAIVNFATTMISIFSENRYFKQKYKNNKISSLYQLAFKADDEENYEVAYGYFKQLSTMGEKEADYFLGYYYQNGLGIKQDYIKAFEYYQKAATKDKKYAACALGIIYLNGWGTDKDIEKAISWLKMAANNDSEQAKNILQTLNQ